MDLRLLPGLIGSIVLIAGAALPDSPAAVAWKNGRNWLFAFGNVCMSLYALLGYLAGGSIFFLILQIYILSSTVFMMLGTPDRWDTPVLGVIGLALTVWALMLFRGYETIVFVCGFVLLGLGFALETGTAKRELALILGSIMIAVFSFLMRDWVFTILNVSFALFSMLHLLPLHTLATKKR